MNRRAFLSKVVKYITLMGSADSFAKSRNKMGYSPFCKFTSTSTQTQENLITLFLCGDVMTGRGIDQVMPYSVSPQLYEPYVRNANRYVDLAESKNGPIQKPVSNSYIWGDALQVLNELKPDLRIINLETSITTSEEYWPGKGINYRMHPKNVDCLVAANIDACVLANNHVMDWGYEGLLETMATLRTAGIRFTGAGKNRIESETPVIFEKSKNSRVILFSYATESSGTPYNWQAEDKRSGVNVLDDLSDETVNKITSMIRKIKIKNDIVVFSIHWGGNWGYQVYDKQIDFAHKLIDEAQVDIIHGHSSHHPKGIEVYKNKPIIYGCGDFLNDYEGIDGYESYRDDLSLMYFITFNTSKGEVECFTLVPTQIKNFRVNHASANDVLWLGKMLNREGKQFNTHVDLDKNNRFTLSW